MSLSISFLSFPNNIFLIKFSPNFLNNLFMLDFINSSPFMSNSSTATPSLLVTYIAYLRLPVVSTPAQITSCFNWK